ncbi:MAG: glycosyltransferase family 39 protein [Bacteroidetes bacterium]|nr:glycosyltransferase family 39 protein [Bacteroidota bacterium]
MLLPFKWMQQRSIKEILIISFCVRLIAVFFSKGYGMHDDHFLIIEASQSWVDGGDYNNWLPKEGGNQTPSGHSLFYTGLHFIFFYMLKLLGVVDAQTKMFFVRLVHAVFSLGIIYWGYKIVKKLANETAALQTAWLLGLFWFMPFLSVRNLVEVVCIPFLVVGTWFLLKDETKSKFYFISGLLIGIAFSIRFQTALFAGGLGLVLLLQKKWKGVFLFGLGYVLCAVAIQGGIDWFIWKRPFAEFQEYVNYNILNANEYISNTWYSYLLLVLGIFIPPVSLFIFYGVFVRWKEKLILFIPTLIFFSFHSYFPNKQERFIFPVVPFIVMMGVMGWTAFVESSNFWKNRQRMVSIITKSFWVLNGIILLVVSTAYSKKSRVEAMCYLASKGDTRALLIEDSNHGDYSMPPLFYLQKNVRYYGITSNYSSTQAMEEIHRNEKKDYPNYVLFMEKDNLEERIDSLKKVLPNIAYEATIEPSFIDKLVHWLNPVNKNQTATIYRITKQE